MKQTLLAINDALDRIPGLFIDKNRGQLLVHPSPVKYPCALLDFGSIQYTQQGSLYQLAVAEINIDVCVNSIRRSSSKAPAADREASYSVFDTIESIHQTLQGLQSDHFTPLVRVGMGHLESDYEFDAYRLIYRTTFMVPKQRRSAPVAATPDIRVSN